MEVLAVRGDVVTGAGMGSQTGFFLTFSSFMDLDFKKLQGYLGN